MDTEGDTTGTTGVAPDQSRGRDEDEHEHPIFKYHLLYPMYLLFTFKDIVVGKAQLRKQLRGDVMVLKHRTVLIALLIRTKGRMSEGEEAKSPTSDGREAENPTSDGGESEGSKSDGREAERPDLGVEGVVQALGVDPGLLEMADVGSDVVEDMAWGAMQLDRGEVDTFETLLDIRRRTYRDYFEARNPGASGTAVREQLEAGTPNRNVFPWAKKTMDLLNEAESRTLFRTEDAFRAYFEARRLLVYGLAALDRNAVRIRARSVLGRARDLSDETRRETIEDLLTENGKLKERLSLQEVLEANEILHAHYLDVYRRMESIRINILNFMANTLFAIIVIVFLFRGVVEPGQGVLGLNLLGFPIEIPTFLILVMVFGVMGASISGLLTAEQGSDATRHLEQVLGSWLALARTIIGAASALLIYVLILAGMPIEATLPPLVLGVSFAAGFSERLLIRTIGTLESLGPGK